MNILLAIAIGIILIGAGYLLHSEVVEKDLKSLEWYKANLLTRQGFTSFEDVGSYQLASIDGGKNWIAFDENGKALGDAETIYPGLVKNLEGMDALSEYVKKNGPITALNDEERNLLNNAGIEIKNST